MKKKVMKNNKIRYLILFFEFLALFVSLAFKNRIVSLSLMTICVITSMLILYFKLPELTPSISQDNPKMKTLKKVTLFNMGLLIACIVSALLNFTGLVTMPAENEKYFAALIIIIVILFSGNMSPKLPFSRHTGLRLPWTVIDEDTWVVAHRIIGYMSIPLALIYVAGLFLTENFETLTFIIVAFWIGVPSVYSYIYYYKKTHGKL